MARWGQRFLVLCTAWLITGLCFGSAFARSLQSGQELFILRVIAPTPAAIAQLTDGRYDLLEARQGDALFVLGDQTVLRSLRAEGFEVSVYARLPERRESFAPFTYFGGYRTVAEHYAHLDAVAAMHPELATVVDYGDSWRKVNNRPNGHDLLAICITKRRPNDCQLTPNTDKPRLLLIAAIHARELSTSEMAWRWIDELVSQYGQHPDITWLLDYHEMWVIPVANPDGRHLVEQGGSAPYLQRKNMNDSAGTCLSPGDPNYIYSQPGVDLNRNASFKWAGAGSSSAPCNQTYRGATAASEPEQSALEALMAQLFHDTRGPLDSDAAPITTTGAMLTLHSFSDLILLPWGWTNCGGPCPPGQRAPNDAGLRAFAFRMSHYNGYAVGQASELLYPASGTTDDWAYGALGVPSFTFEIGPIDGTCGFFTPAYRCQDDLFWPLNRPAFLYAAKVARRPYQLVHGPTTFTVTLSSPAVLSGQPVTLTALIRDDAYGSAANSVGRPATYSIVAAEAYVRLPDWAGGTAIPMTAQDGAFDSPVETATAVINTSGLSAGRYLIFVRGQNAAGYWGPVTAQWLTVLGEWYFPVVRR
jgi:carboxypeptidase T